MELFQKCPTVWHTESYSLIDLARHSLKITLLLVFKIERVLNFPAHRRWRNSSQPLELKHRRDFYGPFPFEPPRDWRDLDGRRAVNIDVKMATQKSNLKLDLIKELEKELKEQNFSAFDPDLTTACPNCKKLVAENKVLLKEIDTLATMNSVSGEGPCPGCKKIIMENIALKKMLHLTISFLWTKCDRLIHATNGIARHEPWLQEFHIFDSAHTREYVIDPENPLWNIVIGSKGHEMRISPITEIDIDFNSFSATVLSHRSVPRQFEEKPPVEKLNFRIRVMALDQGFVYPGETLMLNMKRVNLPPTSMKFKWYLERDGEYGTLPSNMRLSPSGGVLTISELRKEQEGILVCAVFTNKDYFATKQRFLIKEMNTTNNLLLFMPTRPPLNSRWRRRVNVEGFVESSLVDSENYVPISGLDPKSSRVGGLANRQDASELYYPYESIARRIDREYIASEDKVGTPSNTPAPSHDGIEMPVSSEIETVAPSDMMQQSDEILPRPQPQDKPLLLNNVPPNPAVDEYPENNKEEIILELEKKMDSSNKAQDALSQMISNCHSDMQCSADALCIQHNPNAPGFCRCTEGFQGNGIFCWEEIKVRSSAVYSENQRAENAATLNGNEASRSPRHVVSSPNSEVIPTISM
ncbi:uncharacterized protein TNCT_247071, partial [Trichonephila clavata]